MGGLVSPIGVHGEMNTEQEDVDVEEEEMAVGDEEEDEDLFDEGHPHRGGPQAAEEDFGEDLTGVINGERDWPRLALS